MCKVADIIKRNKRTGVFFVEEKVKLSDDALKVRNEYARKWRIENRDKMREYQRRYWEKKAKEAEGKKDG